MNNDLTKGSVIKTLVYFALPYLFAAFLQTFYGLCDLFVVGLYNGSEATTAVSVGSQIMHMLTVIILGFAMGTTVSIGRFVGEKDKKGASDSVFASFIFFVGFAVLVTIVLLIFTGNIVSIMMTPEEAVEDTVSYLRVCFAGIPFIVAFNVLSSIFRGAGDSKRPLLFVAIACVVNIVLDFVFVGGFALSAKGAAYATVIGQAFSVLFAVVFLVDINRSKISGNSPKIFKGGYELGFTVSIKGNKLNKQILSDILKVGFPIALQDGLIQVAFVVITIIANSRGLIAAASVGISEKIIGFMFLVPSAFLSAISAITAQNMGAGLPDRAKKTLKAGLLITVSWGVICAVYNQFLPETLVGIFTNDNAVLFSGSEYLMSYSIDTVFAAVHFCFSGYFCGDRKSIISFIHNIISIVLVRIPGAYFASIYYPQTLYPMGLAAPLGSLLSAVICVCFFMYFNKKECK